MNSMQNRIAIILPALNEAATIGPVIEAFWRQLPEAEIVVVDNGSSDSTGDLAREKMLSLGVRGRVIKEPRRGKGNAMRQAFFAVEADIYVVADADLTYPPESLEELIRPVATGDADMVVGDRLSSGHYARENKRALHCFGNNLVRSLINGLFNASLSDIMSGYRALGRRLVKNYPILVEGFEIEADLTLYALDKRFRIMEVPIPYRDRPPGSVSKLNTLRDGARVLFTIAQILRYYRPLAFFGGLGCLFALCGLGAAIPVFDDWVSYRYIYHVPLAILAAALETVAVMSLGIGLTLDSITRQHRMEAERKLHS